MFSLVFRMAFLCCIYSLRVTGWENNRSNTEHTMVLVIRPLFFHGFGGTGVFVIRFQSVVICDCYFASEVL